MTLSSPLLQQSSVDILVRCVNLQGVERGSTVASSTGLGLRQRLGRRPWLRYGARWLKAGRIGEEDKCQGLGDLFGERVIKNKGIVTPFAGRYIVGPLGYLVCLTLARPFNWFEPNPRQLLDNSRWLLTRAGSRRRCGQVLV